MKSKWLPLQESWKMTQGGDLKFDGLSVAATLRIQIPNGVLAFFENGLDEGTVRTTISEMAHWLVHQEGRPIGTVDSREVPLMLTVRFGDKHSDSSKPLSVSYIVHPHPFYLENLPYNLGTSLGD